ncbi:MAG: TonB-dependent receptor [Allomuricauda sp.]|nr:MAG: TonB-dependent receptor [Allomuricauda sp.]
MTPVKSVLFVGFLLFCFGLRAQTAILTGVILDEQNQPIPNVNISSGESGTISASDGFYLLRLVADQENTIIFSHVGHKNVVLEGLLLNTNETFEFNPILKIDVVQVSGVVVTPTGEKSVSGITTVTPEVVRKIPGANAGIENILKLLPGVSFNNELSTQYNVRGGNFDENLVYVNGIEVYRPFLVRSAQQEGLSFVNSSMVSQVDFSAGGFQAQYGDKLSSVLDITYKIPTEFALQADASLLGASATVETLSKNKKLSSITGVRYRTNALFVNSQQTQSNVRPSFFDAQSYFTYQLSDQLRLNFLGGIAINDYQNQPLNRQTNFGTLLAPRALLVFYEGNENNRYDTQMGALKLDYKLNEKIDLNVTSSIYHATEEEFSDIIASYELGEVNTNLGSDSVGEITTSSGLGSQINRARNELDALIVSLAHHGKYRVDEKLLQWGIRYNHEDFRDQLRESEFLDSAGFFIRPPNPEFVNNQPDEPFNGALVPFEGVRAQNQVTTNRFAAYVQFGNRTQWGGHEVYYNLGVRSQYWSLTGDGFTGNTFFLLSPRGQFAIKPDWDKDILFRLAIGSYQQPPFYRELRGPDGNINPDVKAQKSVHFVLGNEYSFKLWDRPFRLTSEAYFKDLTNINTYTIEDVRLRYRANNNAKAYVYGFDFRLNGTFVPGAESWVSLGYLKTEENQDNRGYISRPTDQRFKFAMLFQDYVASIPNLKLYMNLVYNTGVPGGSPNNADSYQFQSRLRDYRRADLGISYIFVDRNTSYPKDHWMGRFKEFSLGFEIFNLFNNQNSITNTWVRDVDTQNQFAIPNFLTSRVLNLKLSMRF